MLDRDVIPSHYSLESTPQYSDGGVFSNLRLRHGEVQRIVYPGDKDSLSKKFIEYTVFVQHSENGVGLGRMYEHCLLLNPLCGVADRMYWTLRAPAQPSTSQPSKRYLGLGSKVLLLCVNGQTANAVIVGGLRDASDDDLKAKDLGHHLHTRFNGLSIYVDKDGQLVVTCSGRTKIDGKAEDDVSKTAGSTIKMGKDGAIQLSDKDGKNAVTVDPANKKVTIARDEKFELGGASDYMLLGESFRNAQKQMNQQLKSLFDALQKLLVQAAAQLSAAVSTAPGAPLPQVVAAGGILQGAAQVVSQMSQTVDSFEQSAAQKNSFLSSKNRAD